MERGLESLKIIYGVRLPMFYSVLRITLVCSYSHGSHTIKCPGHFATLEFRFLSWNMVLSSIRTIGYLQRSTLNKHSNANANNQSMVTDDQTKHQEPPRSPSKSHQHGHLPQCPGAVPGLHATAHGRASLSHGLFSCPPQEQRH